MLPCLLDVDFHPRAVVNHKQGLADSVHPGQSCGGYQASRYAKMYRESHDIKKPFCGYFEFWIMNLMNLYCESCPYISNVVFKSEMLLGWVDTPRRTNQREFGEGHYRTIVFLSPCVMGIYVVDYCKPQFLRYRIDCSLRLESKY